MIQGTSELKLQIKYRNFSALAAGLSQQPGRANLPRGLAGFDSTCNRPICFQRDALETFTNGYSAKKLNRLLQSFVHSRVRRSNSRKSPVESAA